MIEGEYNKLGNKTLLIFILRRSRIFFIFLLIAAVIYFGKGFFNTMALNQYENLFNNGLLLSLALALISLLLGILTAWLEYSRFRIMLDINTFKITRGVLTKEEFSLPYRRIQAIDIVQTPLYQIFGVGRLTIETTADGEENADKKNNFDDEVLPVIDHKLALEIQQELTKRANVQRFSP